MKRLDNKVAIVTGASKGIGAGIAKAFGAEGAAVIVNYARDQAGAERVVREIIDNGGRAVAVEGDVAQRSDAQRLVAEAKKAFDRLELFGPEAVDDAVAVDEAKFLDRSRTRARRRRARNCWMRASPACRISIGPIYTDGTKETPDE